MRSYLSKNKNYTIKTSDLFSLFLNVFLRYYHAPKDKILHFCCSFRRTPWSFFTSVTCRTPCNHQMFFQVLSKLIFILTYAFPTLFFIVDFFFTCHWYSTLTFQVPTGLHQLSALPRPRLLFVACSFRSFH